MKALLQKEKLRNDNVITPKKHELAKCIALYAVIWLFCAMILCCIFRSNSVSYIWKVDGLDQHYPAFNYLCDFLKELLVHHRMPAFYNYTLGQGLDILATLGTYDFTDPISIFAALLFPLTRVQRYTAMIFMKLFLIGLSFIGYCWSRRQKNVYAVAGGAVAYCFSGAVLATLGNHPNFINWAYFFPFILSGIEYYCRDGKRVPLVLYVCLNAVISYYTLFMNAVLAAIYVVVEGVYHSISDRSWKTAKIWAGKVISVAAVSCVGVLLASAVIMPSVFVFLSNSRKAMASGYLASNWLYGKNYYPKLFESIFAPHYSAGDYSVLGINAALFIPLVLLFLGKRKNTQLKILIVICALMMCVPLCGRIMNGMGYACNRWAYAIPFFASAALVAMWQDMHNMTPGQKGGLFMAVVFYVLICLLNTDTNTNVQKYSALFMIVWVSAMCGIALTSFKGINRSRLLLLFIFIGSIYQIVFTFSNYGAYHSRDFLARSNVNKTLINDSGSAAVGLSEGFYRIETEENLSNRDGFNGVNGTGTYWSVLPSTMFDYHRTLGLRTIPQNVRLYGLDGRTGLLEIAGVKYYTKRNTGSDMIPYGYEKTLETPQYQVFENPYALPIGYTYTGYITEDTYNGLNVFEKEQALLQAAVLEAPMDGYQKLDISTAYSALDYNVTETENVKLTSKNINVAKASGFITLDADIPEDCEIYFFIKGAALKNTYKSVNVVVSRNQEGYSVSKSGKISSSLYYWPAFVDDMAFNLGYGHAGQNTIKITFRAKAEIDFQDIQIIAVPMDAYPIRARALGEYVLENVDVGNDYVTGTIDVPEDRILQFAIPYSKGWKATVDGRTQQIYRSGGMYMSIPISAGNHMIELRYHTPYLRLGLAVSGITLISWIAYELWRRKRTGKSRKALIK